MASLGERRVIEEGITNRLFYLIDKIADEKEMRNMGFFVGHFVRRFRIESRVHHCRDQRVLRPPINYRAICRVNAWHRYTPGSKYRNYNASGEKSRELRAQIPTSGKNRRAIFTRWNNAGC